MKRRICYEISYPIPLLTREILVKWCAAGCECFTPKRMSGDSITNSRTRAYKEKTFYDGLEKEIPGRIAIRLTDGEGNHIWATKGPSYNAVILSATIHEMQLKGDFDQLLDDLMIDGGIVGRKVTSEDEFWQNSEELSAYQEEGRSLEGVKTKTSTIGLKREIVDTEGNPGHSHWVRGLWFGSCHKMWFGRDYYQYIGKERLENYTCVYENTKLGKEVIRITLYSDPWDYEKAENRALQWDFRRTAGMDEAARLLEQTPDMAGRACIPLSTEANVTVEIVNGEFPHGGTKLIKYYVDHAGNPSAKNLAAEVRVMEYSASGKLLEQYLQRMDG